MALSFVEREGKPKEGEREREGGGGNSYAYRGKHYNLCPHIHECERHVVAVNMKVLCTSV